MKHTKIYALTAFPLAVASWLICYFSPKDSSAYPCAIATSGVAVIGLLLIALLETKLK